MSLAPVQTGLWIDHSKGTVLGATLTYNSRWGSQLVALASVLVQVTGTAIWVLLALWLHQASISSSDEDEFDAQRSVILRNSGAVPAVLNFWNLGSTWHGRAPRAWPRALKAMAVPLFVTIAFAVAGVLVAFIALDPSTTHVLAEPGNCGVLGNAERVSTNFSNTLTIIQNNVTLRSQSYARECYGGIDTTQAKCSAYASPALPYAKAFNVPCPIGSNKCALGDNHAIRFYTRLDTHHDLGINAKPEERLKYAYNLTCAPLLDSFVSQFRTGAIFETYDINGTTPSNRYSLNYYKISADDWWDGEPTFSSSQLARDVGGYDYKLQNFVSYAPHENLVPSADHTWTLNNYAYYSSDVIVNQSLKVQHTDVTFITVSPEQVVYSGSSNDPFFGTDPSYELPPTEEGYYNDIRIPPREGPSSMICTEQYQICSPSTCTPWMGQVETFFANISSALDLNDEQNATLYKIYPGNVSTSLQLVLNTLSPLQASQQIADPPLSLPLPDDQWAVEIEFWFQTMLAGMQISHYGGIQTPDWMVQTFGLSPWPTAAARGQCYKLRIQIPPGYQSYSVFGLMFVLVFALVFTILAIVVRKYHYSILPGRQGGQKNRVKALRFVSDGQLQLHRATLEKSGYGGWIDEGDPVAKETPYVQRASKRLPPLATASSNSAFAGQAEELGERYEAKPRVVPGNVEDQFLLNRDFEPFWRKPVASVQPTQISHVWDD